MVATAHHNILVPTLVEAPHLRGVEAVEPGLCIGKEEVVAVYHSAVGRQPGVTRAVCLHALHVAMEVETTIVTAHILQCLAAVG